MHRDAKLKDQVAWQNKQLSDFIEYELLTFSWTIVY